MNKSENADLDKEVAGEYNTFRVYLRMLKEKHSSARDVQNALGFSSPALAQYHLEKLLRYKLVSKDETGTYNVIPKTFGILKLYVRGGRWIIPRTIFFVLIFGILSTGFILSIPQHRFFLFAFLFSTAGLIYALYETIRFYKALPRA